MQADQVKKLFNQHFVVDELVGGAWKNGRSFWIKGLVGSGEVFVSGSIVKSTGTDHLFLLEDKESAAYFYNDFQRLFSEECETLFYPSAYRVPYQTEESDNSNVGLRAEVLRTLNEPASKPRVIISYPAALSEFVVTRQELTSHTFTVKAGENYSVDFLNELFTEYEFQRVDYVYEPGQFSIRGGIMDVFSFADDTPYRLEFFGDEVESIRKFDPATQLSIEKTSQLVILPNVQKKILQEGRENFLSYLSSETTIWLKNTELVASVLDAEFEKAQEQYAKLKSILNHLPPEKQYITGDVFKKQAGEFRLVNFGTTAPTGQAQTFQANQSPQPVFNKNFELLIKNLNENSAQGFQNLIYSNNEKQIERLQRIFSDIGKDVSFEPVVTELAEGFTDKDLKICCYTDHQIFERYHRFYLKEGYKKNKEALTIKELNSLEPGDYVTHIDHGIGKFSGLEKIDVNGKQQEAIRLVYRDNDILYVSIHSLHRISKYSGKEGTQPAINKLGSAAWQKTKAKTKNRVKEIAYDLISLYAKRKTTKGFAFAPDNYLQHELEASFIYEDTPDQLKATQQVKDDMESESPMDRLICGDVGFGKTEIAIRAAFKAVNDNKQVAVLVPTTILSLQHYRNFRERLKDFPCTVSYINRFKTGAKQTETLKKLASGEIDIIIGTHKLVSKSVKFKDLGLMIIDEEQKFGVAVKDKLKTLKENVDTLTLTATPIPRTLQFSLMGARDLSIISTPPPNRFPVQTSLHTFNEEIIRDAINYEVSRGGQVFFVHNKIGNITEMAGMIQRLCPDVKVAIGHGQMEGKALERIMTDFIDGLYDVLIATTIIESGIDIPNANTIIINNANTFGLSDLHQLRGRVGRSNKKAFCYLLAPPVSVLTPEARKRLQAIEQFTDLGSGMNIAMRDLDIRGAGDLLGGEQSGFINEMGFETYQKILDEAIRELKETEFQDVYASDKPQAFLTDAQLETDFEILIPDTYVSEITERLRLYQDIDNLNTDADIERFRLELRDRFGDIPPQTEDLLKALKLRWLARDLGIEKLTLKGDKLVAHFIQNQDSPYYQSAVFTQILNFFRSNPPGYKMYEKNGSLRVSKDKIQTIDAAIEALKPMREQHIAEGV